MGDMFTKAKRSEIMSRIRSKETVAERIVFKYLRANKIYFQKHYRRAAGTPDVALPRKKRAVFVDSEFWHGKDYQNLVKNGKLDDFWKNKIAVNIERDTKNRDKLRAEGWQVLVVWEKDVKRKRTRQESLLSIAHFLMN